ncbi:MAG: hypothetical protein KAV41_01540 [Candidatus Pacebacteria bacterium]|nr:hypothetical protein [Candidatus Paceibacterota bacterium]
MEILSKLFGSSARIKIMKLFLSNPDDVFNNKEISKRAKVVLATVRKELNLLDKISFINKKAAVAKIKKTASAIRRSKNGKKASGCILNPNFPFLAPLQNLLIKNSPLESKEIIGRLKGGGKLKLVIASGVFIQDLDSRIDILIVGGDLNNAYLERALRILESEIGQELRYVILDTPDFEYRLGVYDKLLRDVLDYPHKKLINKLNL